MTQTALIDVNAASMNPIPRPALALWGRGSVHAIPAAGGRWVVRAYRRGGAVAGPLLGDRYLGRGSGRPVAETLASEEARRRGVPTPRVVAGAVYPAGPLFYRADLVTEFVEGGRELARVLFGAPAGADERGRALAQAGRLLARLAEAGVEHPDLNARNVLLTPGSQEGALVLDLDRSRVGPEGVPLSPARMLARLERSLEKLGERAGRALSSEELDLLRLASGGGP